MICESIYVFLELSEVLEVAFSDIAYGQVRLLILPNLEAYLKLLEPEMLFEKQKNELKRYEAWRVYGALQVSMLEK